MDLIAKRSDTDQMAAVKTLNPSVGMELASYPELQLPLAGRQDGGGIKGKSIGSSAANGSEAHHSVTLLSAHDR
jgi:hypothetical protein